MTVTINPKIHTIIFKMFKFGSFKNKYSLKVIKIVLLTFVDVIILVDHILQIYNFCIKSETVIFTSQIAKFKSREGFLIKKHLKK